MTETPQTKIDVAIIGGGPAGLQAALVLTRTRKDVVVFDAPAPPRNGASHGVHNFVGLDGLRPQEIRDQAWSQIHKYNTATKQDSDVLNISRAHTTEDFIVETASGSWRARHVLLACGYADEHPSIDGFAECWADTIIPCPFCDGFENRDRLWGIVPSMSHELDVFPTMVQNWTDRRVVIAPVDFDITREQQNALVALDVPLHIGDIVSITHDDGKTQAVTLSSGEVVEVETLLWTPPEKPALLITKLVDDLGLALNEDGYVAVDDMQRTNVNGLWAAGDVQGWMGAIESANSGGMAATMIVHGWHTATSDVRS